MRKQFSNGGTTEELCDGRALGSNGELVASLLRGSDEARRSERGQQMNQLARGVDVAATARPVQPTPVYGHHLAPAA